MYESIYDRCNKQINVPVLSNNSSNRVYNEDHSNDIGKNIIELPYQYVLESIIIHLNGIRLKLNVEYVELGSNLIQLNFEFDEGSLIIDYDII